MTDWPMVELGNAAEIRGGATPRRDNAAYWGGDIPWVTPTDLPAPGAGIADVDHTADAITGEGLASCPARILPPSTVMFSSRASIGKIGIAAVPLATNQGFINLIPDCGLESRYLAWCLHFHTDRIADLAGSTTFKEVSRSALKRFRIPIPPVSEQRRIVEVLDQADRLRRLRTEAEAKANRILPALFIRMFGDPATNPMKWPRVRFHDLLSHIDSGWSPICEDRRASPSEWGVLKLGAITSNQYLESENKALPSDLEPRSEVEIQTGDLLFSRKNTYALVGACAYVEETRLKLLLSDLIFRLNLKPDSEIHPVYLWGLLTCPSKRPSIEMLASGSAGSMPNISKKRLGSLHIEKPSYDMQIRYTEIVNQVKHLMKFGTLSHKKIERIFNVLLYRAFTGRLTDLVQ